GLCPSTSYLFGIVAKNGTASGRRSVGVSVVPATGTCNLGNFNNDLKAVSIDAPASGRQQTSSALSSTETIRFTIKNLDDQASSGSYDLYYQVNNGSPVMESSSIVIPSLSGVQYSFT